MSGLPVEPDGIRGLAGVLMAAIGTLMLFTPQLARWPWVTRAFGPPGIGTRILGGLLLPAGIYIIATADRW